MQIDTRTASHKNFLGLRWVESIDMHPTSAAAAVLPYDHIAAAEASAGRVGANPPSN